MAAAGVRFCFWRRTIRADYTIPIIRTEYPYVEYDAMMADVFRAVAIGVVILSIARPLLKLAGIVVICVFVLLFV